MRSAGRWLVGLGVVIAWWWTGETDWFWLSLVPILGQIVVPNTFVANTIIDPDQMNQNFNELGTKALNRTGGTISGTLVVAGSLQVTPDIIFTADGYVRRNTADGSDIGFVGLLGGGGPEAFRGARVLAYGNDSGGHVVLRSGDTLSAQVQFRQSNETVAVAIDGATGVASVAQDVAFVSDRTIRRNTSAGSDNGRVSLSGAGARSAAQGAFLDVWGNQGGNPGYIYMQAGNVAGSLLYFARGDGAAAMTINGLNSAVSMSGALSVTGVATLSSTLNVASTTFLAGSVAIGHVGSPVLKLDVRGGGINDGGKMVLANSNLSNYISFYSGQNNDMRSLIHFPSSVPFVLASTTDYNGGGYVEWFSLIGANGAAKHTSTHYIPLTLNSTYSAGGWLEFQRSGVTVGEVGSPGSHYGGYTGADFMIRADNILLLQSALAVGARIDAPPVYSQTTANAANVNVAVNGLLARSTSSRRYKTAIVPLDAADRARILQLQPVAFRSIASGQAHMGLVAEDVAAVEPRLAIAGPDGPDEVAYSHLTAGLLSVIQDLHARVVALEGSR